MIKKLIRPFAIVTSGILTGYLLTSKKDFFYKKYYRFLNPLEQSENILLEEKIFLNNEEFAKKNLILLDLIKKEKDQAEFV
jgi:hypothetical protein